MGFRLVPKSVTLNDLERRNGRVVCVISPNSVALGLEVCTRMGWRESRKIRGFPAGMGMNVTGIPRGWV